MNRALFFTTQKYELIGGIEYIKQDFNNYFINLIEINNKFKRKKYGTLLHLLFRDIISIQKGNQINARIDIENSDSIRFHQSLDFQFFHQAYGDGFYNISYKL